ncbi:hypothetical protein GCM10027046_14900 [Uliginosibacterium flavum]|uniref:PH domain-containing protein n=1 Tax=Uliginosibacterium flavum TaxID=1396831 RepID=A0ABV2TN87_9RHOO
MSKPSRRPSRQNRTSLNPQNLPNYQRRQPARALLTLIFIPVLVCALAAWSHPQYRVTLWVISTMLTIGALLFSSLSIEVSADTLRWRFGPGIVRKQVDLKDIASVEMTRTTWLEGWGIHYTKRGWLYNVSGRNAVLVTQKDGTRFMLGSNDVIGLWEALQNRIG